MALTIDRNRYSHLEGVVVQAGEGADQDAAFDDAVESAHDEIGHSGFVPSVADLDPSSVQVVEERPLPLEVVLTEILREGAYLREGEVRARAVGAPAGWRRKKVTVRIDDPEAELGAPGSVAVLTPELEEYIRGKLAEMGEELSDTTIEQVEIRTLRSRWKPVVTTRKGKRAAKHVAVVRETGEVVGEGRTAGEARRAAVAVVKEGARGDLERYTIEVEQRARLEEGAAIEVARTRVAQKGSIRVTLSSEKDPEKTKTAGWVFYGRPGNEGDDKEGEVVE